jgi:DNA-binding CsgD family transcriptional regulator
VRRFTNLNKQALHIDIEHFLLGIPGQCGSFWKDCNSLYMGCNDVAAEKSLLKSRQDIVEMSDFDLTTLSTAEAKSIRQGDQLVINTQKPHYFLFSATNSQNKNIFLTYKAPLWNLKNEVVGVYGVDTFIDLNNEKTYLPILEKTGIPIEDFMKLKSTIVSQESKIKNKLLTSRQYDCLSYLARGMTIKEIALELKLSARTVEHYLEAVKDKLNCNTRSELVRFFFQKQETI